MIRKNLKKGFTIVELVIVIAVIAILSAILIPVFAGLINKAELSADQALVRNLNTSLALSSGAGQKQNETMYETLEDIKDAGYVVENLTPTSNGNEIVWDKSENQFVLIMKNKDGSIKGYYTGTEKNDYTTVETPNFWKIYKEMPAVGSQKYSIYLAGSEFTGTVEVSGVGFDAGLNKVSVKYTSGANAENVVIRTYFGDLNVDAGSDDVCHYGVVENLTVKNVNKTNCYHEYGYVYKVESGFVSGKFVAESKAVFHETRADVEQALDVTASEEKSFESKLGAQYGEHYFVDGKCVFPECGADKCEHNWNDGEITTEPTCIEAGIKTYTCTLCGKTKTEGVNPKGHSYNLGVVTTEPTCTTEGVKTYTCTVCNDKKTESVQAKGHTWSEVFEHNETSHWKKCSVCNYEDTKVAHTLTYVSVNETNHTKSCECGYSQTENHNFNEIGECSNCGYKKQTTPIIQYTPKITIKLDDKGNSKGLVLDETSVGDANWSRYEIVLRIPFYVADYISEKEYNENEKDNPDYERIEQDYFVGYLKKSTLSEQYKLDFSYSAKKDTNNIYIPYDMTTAFAFWDMKGYGLDISGSADYYIQTPNNENKLVKNVKYSNWGSGNEGYYTTLFTAISGIDVINGLFEDNASKTKCLIQKEEEIPTYIINLYDDKNNLIGTNEYVPVLTAVTDYLESYISQYEKWVGDNSKENTRETISYYCKNVNKFRTNQVELEEIGDSLGIGNTGSEILRSIITSHLQATTSTFDYYKIIIKSNGRKEYTKL